MKIRLPNLALLLRSGLIPDKLRASAIRELLAPGTSGASALSDDSEAVTALYDLYEWLVCQTVVEPLIEPEDLGELPQEDLEMLIGIATRERDTDALGIRLGVEPLSRWETFRREHGCQPGCPACDAVVAALSSADVGAV